MIFNHRVKRNGVYYEAGQDVPIENEKKEETIQEVVEDSLYKSEESLETEIPTPKRGRPKKTE